MKLQSTNIPDPSEPRKAITGAKFAARTLAIYSQFTGTDGEDEDSQLGDLLADLMHMADREGLDFDGCLAMAREHHAEETEPQPDDVAAPLKWYAITGRLPGADEDTCRTYQAASKELAMAAFREWIHEGEDLEAIESEYGETLIINHVLESAGEISAI